MKISTKGRYGMRIMLDVAKNRAGGPVRIADVCARQSISPKYAEQIMGLLSRGGLLRSVRGAQGGYTLVKKPEEYSAAEILKCAEGELSVVECVQDGASCDRAEGCVMRTFWAGLNGAIEGYLNAVTLQSLIDSDPNAADFYSI